MNGADLIAAERKRQIEVEGWTSEHDAQHSSLDLVMAALCYLHPNPVCQIVNGRRVPMEWPWLAQFYKPTPNDRVRELVKAGALIAAEIDRLQAQQVEPKKDET